MNYSAFKAGYLALLGAPNVGKSTLLNNLLDFKLSITSPRPQTTRRKIVGILTGADYQLIILDTPGFLEPRYKLQETFIKQIHLSLADADIICIIIEARRVIAPEFDRIYPLIRLVKQSGKPVILVINKIDLIEKADLLPMIEMISKKYKFEAIVPVSAIEKDGLTGLTNEIVKNLPLHPPFYDPDMITEQPERLFVTELIREQIFLLFQQEIPYTTEVQIEEFSEREKGKVYISVIIYTEKSSQKGILIGKNGRALKDIGVRSRRQIERFLDRDVYLDLHVKVRKDWRKDENQIKKFGYLY
jgi:GTP-binding protein Era